MSSQEIDDIEAYSTIKQEIICYLFVKSDQFNCPVTTQQVIDWVLNYFMGLAPIQSQCFRNVVVRRAQEMEASHH